MSESLVRIKSLAMLALALLATACTYQHTLDKTSAVIAKAGLNDSAEIRRNGDWVLARNSSIYVALPRSANKTAAINAQLANNLGRSLEGQFATVKLGSEVVDLKQAMKSASQNGCGYLFYPRLVAIKDGVSSAQEIDESFYDDDSKQFGLDRLNLQVQVYDAYSGNFLDNINIESQSGWFAIFTNSPEALMQKAFDMAAQSLVAQ